jgi:hypothetical protein
MCFCVWVLMFCVLRIIVVVLIITAFCLDEDSLAQL